MTFTRSSGILFHPTSFPGKYGIGELGPAAYEWVEWLAGAGSTLWQILPLGPTSYGDSPYQCFSAFAGNPYLVSFDLLLEQGLLAASDLTEMPKFDPLRVDFGAIYHWKLPVLDCAFNRFSAGDFPELARAFRAFRQREAHWLDDFSLFMALKDAHAGRPWWEWADALKLRDAAALGKARNAHASAMQKHAFRQFLFFRQWADVRDFAHAKGIQIVGDIPIFVAYDSSDVWANPELFHLDAQGSLTAQAGVPPDYFSETGQLWGNPLYRWDVHKKTGYKWWFDRLRAVFSQVDIVRLDHFRGFYDYWEIPGGAGHAMDGAWKPGPGADFFHKLKAELGDLQIIAEDLGDLRPEVYDLRDEFNLPGMKIMVFAFGVEHPSLFLPHNYAANSIVYTGTHDNDTVHGWYERVTPAERDFARRYLARDGRDIAWDLIREAWRSVSVFAITPIQDLLSLGNEARMNLPGTVSARNWSWRMAEGALTPQLQARLRETNFLYGRLSESAGTGAETESPSA
jgi:4-alpha-glucanotransferase